MPHTLSLLAYLKLPYSSVFPYTLRVHRKTVRFAFIIGSAEALPILCVRCARWERERERERDTERERRKWHHHCCRAKIGEEFYTFPCQKFAPLSPFLNGAEFTLPLPKTLHSSKQFAFFVLLLLNSVTGDRSTETNDRISGCTVLLLIEKMNQINIKN